MKKSFYQIANTIIRKEKAITFPLQNHDGWVSDSNGHHILDIRGWGFLQYADNDEGAMLQDGIADWVVDTLNREWARLDIKGAPGSTGK